jgi:hypothetical protein
MKPDSHGEEQDSTLLAYWLDELGEPEAAEVEEHLFGCDACSARLRELLALRDSVRRALHESRFGTAVSAGFVQHLKDSGLRIREYLPEAGGSVMCTMAPDDDFIVSRLRAPLAGVRQLDLVWEDSGMQHRLVHVPFDPAANEVTFIPSVTMVRSLGAASQRARLVAVNLDSERVIAEYTFNHRPWGET